MAAGKEWMKYGKEKRKAHSDFYVNMHSIVPVYNASRAAIKRPSRFNAG